MENMNTWQIALGHKDLSHLEHQPKAEKPAKVKQARRSKYHEAVVRLHRQGLNNAQIARMLGIARSTVRYDLRSAGLASTGKRKGVTLLSPGKERRFSGLNEAALELGLSAISISKVCNGKQTETKGHIFKWSEG